MREQISGKYDICFQETRITGIPFDKSINQGGKEIPCLFNLMMRSVFKTMQEEWKNLPMGFKMRGSRTDQEEGRVRHMIFADNCHLFAETRVQILKMLGDAAGNLKKRGLDWKEDQMDSFPGALMKRLESQEQPFLTASGTSGKKGKDRLRGRNTGGKKVKHYLKRKRTGRTRLASGRGREAEERDDVSSLKVERKKNFKLEGN